MCGFLSFFDRGSVTQLAVGQMWTLLFMVAVTQSRPFVADFADALKAAVDCAVLITLALSVLLKVDLSNEEFSADEIAIAMLAANVLLPLGVVVWHLPALCGSGADEDSAASKDETKSIDAIFEMLDRDNGGWLSQMELESFVRVR